MIISASRRTDIPAFYGDWFLRRLQEGFVLVRNPLNFRQVSRVALDGSSVDAYVFWTKNIRPFWPVLDYLESRACPFYIQHTLNHYPPGIETAVPPLAERLDTLLRLSDRIGPERLMWRYDPILLAPGIDAEAHLEQFAGLCRVLAGAVTDCTFSFVVDYAKTRRNTRHLSLQYPDQPARVGLVAGLAGIARQYGIALQCCCGEDYRELDVRPAACISRERLERLCGRPLADRKDTGQRPNCHCIQSVDIGAYDTCRHGCQYCYASSSPIRSLAGSRDFDQTSAILGPPLQDGDRLTERKMR